ncbi:structure-specific endonuclease subunit SLX4 [Parambassis ranga]|uniref:Structure-specific endonuclease subunit SLX4 n=1 Tax=Parambassis ranga TaxID=210632 RepID=A0A6P7HWL8_9TELE|nr:structure-specific endonuclease subunit SLX4 [Parambassis ranga]XP_028256556.1 structure-specific endonuclease subunit SLX4 [Parambassis ranga]
MDDSDLDFVDLCSKLLKRVRKKPGEAKKADHQTTSQGSEGDKRRKNSKKDGNSVSKQTGTQSVSAGAEQCDDGGSRHVSGDAGSSDAPCTAAAAGPITDGGTRAKDKVLLKMQQFKRAIPQKMVHSDGIQQTDHENVSTSNQQQRQETPDSDEALALRLQEEMDKEAADAQTADLEDRGLFFCQICQRDLSHVSPNGRTQHLNRCLDESEDSTPAPPPASGIPDCPICGKKFKSKKGRSAHLKRCASDMGVAPAELMQALHRQAEESQTTTTANTLVQPTGTKRKGTSKPGLAAKKKPRKKTQPMDEETMVALALSSSLLEQERAQRREEEEAERQLQTETAASLVSMRPDTGVARVRGKRKKGAIPRSPPLLLVQDTATALTRLQERVSAFLHNRPPSPPTPTLCPSTLPGWSGAAPLWQKSTLLDRGSTCLSDFYAPELREFFVPVTTDAASFSSGKTSIQPVAEEGGGTPVTGVMAVSSNPPSSSQMASCSPAPSTPGTGQLPVSSQALQDLIELAEEGMTLTQYGYTAKDKQINANVSANLHLSGFIQDESEEPANLCISGFLPETAHTHSEDNLSQVKKMPDQERTDKDGGSHQSVALCGLASDLSSMVNNPQLSDLQFQVDSGEVYFAHSFMVYARCPLLAEMVHESGFRVQEEGMPAAQRVLLNDVPGQAVFSLLQYLYTARCSIPTSQQPHVLELASRFDLQELQKLCHLQQEEGAAGSLGNEAEDVNNQTDQAFMQLLNSMWNEEDENDDSVERDEERHLEEDHQSDEVMSRDRELHDEQVNEEELEEIYEFAATQRKQEEKDTEEDEEEEEDGEAVFTKLKEPTSEKNQQPNLESHSRLDRSYSRLFSDSWGIYEDGDPSHSASTVGPPKIPQSRNQSPHKPSSQVSGRTLLQSSASVVDDLTLSPPPSPSNLPVAGLSPGGLDEQDGKGEDAVDEHLSLKRESQGPRSISHLLSPGSPQKKKEPELIVLSDSSEEMEVDVAVVNSKQDPTPNKPPLENKVSTCLESSPGDALDCSPEVSWLIPSTPVQPEGSNSRSCSTQTKSSICRVQLFPRADSSPPASPGNMLHTSISPSTGSVHSASSLKLGRMLLCSSSSSNDASKEREALAHPSSQSNLSRLSRSFHCHSLQRASKQDAPLLPYSSTPMNTELHSHSASLAVSLLPNDPDKQTSASQRTDRASSESLEKTELGSFHLSPLSDPSDPPCSSSHSDLQSSKRHSKSSSQSRQFESSNCPIGKTETHFSSTSVANEGEQEEVSSFHQSFMDEPPIAFNDSWGLDACVEAGPGHFSLRLEDSRSPGQQTTSPPASHVRTLNSHGDLTTPSPAKGHSPQSPPEPNTTPEIDNGLLDSKIWDSWEEEEEEEALPLSQRVNPSAKLRTPAQSHNKRRRTMVPITPMPHYSDMDTPDLKNKLNRFGVRPLPKRQMILKLKEIHQYTHQLVGSDSEDETASSRPSAQVKPPPSRPVSCTQTVKFKEPRVPAAVSPVKHSRAEEEEGPPLSASQGSNTSSTAASEESERSNPEICISSDGDSDSDGGISSSQAASRLQDRLQAVQSFILSDPGLYNQILQYQPLVLSQLQERLKSAGIRLGAAKLVDYLDSRCITFTTAKPGHLAPSRRRGKKTSKVAKAGVSRKKVITAMV